MRVPSRMARGGVRSRKTIRVLVVGLRAIIGAQGGIESHVRDLLSAISRLPDADIEFEVLERRTYVDPQRTIPSELSRIRLTQLWNTRSAQLEAITHTALGILYAGIKRPDVVHIHGIGPAIMAPLAKLLALRVIVTHHGEDYAREKWGVVARTALRLGEFCAARFSDERIVIAPTLDAKLAERFGREFRYIPNGINPAKPSNDPTILERWGLTSGRYVIHVGRFVPEKRQTDLIQAFKQLSLPGWRLVLVGGSDHTSPFAVETERAAASDIRIVLTGPIDRSEVAELLEHAGIFALPSTHEGLPIALLEAMSFGLPVLVSDLENLVALGLPRECYVPRLDVERLAARLQELASQSSNHPIRLDWTQWMNMFTMDSVASRTIDAYCDCAGFVRWKEQGERMTS